MRLSYEIDGVKYILIDFKNGVARYKRVEG
jgi:hypothetical protein